MRTGLQKKTLKEKYNVVAADNLLRREKKVKKGKLKFWSSDAVGTLCVVGMLWYKYKDIYVDKDQEKGKVNWKMSLIMLRSVKVC